jgi:excisionase family DNA binding protein
MARFMTEREAAERLGLSVRTLQKWRLLGSGPEFLKLGHAVRYDPEDLERYVESARRRSTSEQGSFDHEAGIRLPLRRRAVQPG